MSILIVDAIVSTELEILFILAVVFPQLEFNKVTQGKNSSWQQVGRTTIDLIYHNEIM